MDKFVEYSLHLFIFNYLLQYLKQNNIIQKTFKGEN